MTRAYLRPEDVDPVDAARVLAALNGIRSADELALAVEFPDELDIGVRIAARILARREELGRFTSLQQVAAVRLVGPERFTELVLGILGRPLPWALPAQDDGGLRAELAALRAEIAALRAEAAVLALRADEQAPRVRVDPTGPWLGQPVIVTVDSEPRDIVLVNASRGRLQPLTGAGLDEGNAAVVTTDTAGRARLEWRPVVRVPLSPEQRAALAAHLPLLGDVDTPSQATDGLRALASAYDEPPNRSLREAVDALAAYLDRAPPDARGGWPLLDVTIMVTRLAGSAADEVEAAEAAAPGAGVQGRGAGAAAAVRFALRDWLTAFEDALVAHLVASSPLRSQLSGAVAAKVGTAAGAAIQERLASYISNRPGELGQRAAREVTQTALHAVLARTTDGEVEERQSLVPLLTATTRAVRVDSATVLGVVEATGTSVRRDVDERIPTAQLDTLANRLDDLQLAVADRVPRQELQAALAAKADSELVSQRFTQLTELAGKISRIEQQIERQQ